MITITLYVFDSMLWDIVLAVLVIVVVAYIAKWLVGFIPILGG